MNQEEKFFNPEAEEKIDEAIGLFLNGKINEAEKLFQGVTRDFPEFFPGWLAYGDFFLSCDKPSLALNPLRKAVNLVSSEGSAYFGLAAAFMKLGRFYFAKKALETAAVFIPENPEITRSQGYAQAMLGNIEEGRKLLRETINRDPLNGMAYYDLAQTYVMECNFDEALYWLEIAKNLDPENRFIAINIRECKKIQKDFLALPKNKQEERRKLILQKEYRGEMRIQLLMQGLAESQGTKEDINEVVEELRQTGLIGQIAMFRDPKNKEGRAAIAYINEHKKIQSAEKKLQPKDIQDLGRKLFGKTTPPAFKKTVLIRLAHQGTKKALKFLENYCKNPDPKLKIWAKMAYEECQSFLEDKESGRSVMQGHKIEG